MQPDRQIYSQTGRYTVQPDMEKYNRTGRHIARQADLQLDSRTYNQTGRYTARQAHDEPDRHAQSHVCRKIQSTARETQAVRQTCSQKKLIYHQQSQDRRRGKCQSYIWTIQYIPRHTDARHTEEQTGYYMYSQRSRHTVQPDRRTSDRQVKQTYSQTGTHICRLTSRRRLEM